MTLLAQSLQQLVKHLHLTTAINYMCWFDNLSVGIKMSYVDLLRPRPFDIGVIASMASILKTISI